MASRKEQKELARGRRLAEERARAERARRQQRLRLFAGVGVGAIAVIAVAVAVATGGGGGKSGTGTPSKLASNSGVKLPTQKTTNLTAAVKAAGCVTVDTPDAIARTDANRTHVQPGTKVPYATNPPSYGPHYPAPASDGEYKASNIPATGFLVHALEHGRIDRVPVPAGSARSSP